MKNSVSKHFKLLIHPNCSEATELDAEYDQTLSIQVRWSTLTHDVEILILVTYPSISGSIPHLSSPVFSSLFTKKTTPLDKVNS